MTAETMEWLNTQTLIGFTDKRGNAWHYRADLQGDNPNHYPGPVPVEAVRERLFNWHAVSGTIAATAITPEGVTTITDSERQAIMRPAGALSATDAGGILGIFKSGYQMHQYDEWLIDTLQAIISDELGIGGAGLLRQGGQAFVCIELPDSITTPSGVEYRPNLLAATSLDGTLATIYKRVVTNVVCDNTMAAGLSESGQEFKVKHTRYSTAKLNDVRQALEIIHTVADDFAAQVEQLTNIDVSEGDWNRFLDSLPMTASMDPNTGKPREGRSLTMATNHRDALASLYENDNRVTPWSGTAWGVVQAVNTYEHHVKGSKRGADRAERNMANAVTGKTDELDRSTLQVLQTVLA